MSEFWKDVPGYERLYQVSHLGSVRSLFKKTRGREVPLILKPFNYGKGYRGVCLFKRDGSRRFEYIHRVVLLTFRGAPAHDEQAAHLDGNRTNNALDNLRWTSPSENLAHRLYHGTKNKGERSGTAKLTASDVLACRARFVSGSKSDGSHALAKAYGVAQPTMHDALTGRRWSHLPGAVAVSK